MVCAFLLMYLMINWYVFHDLVESLMSVNKVVCPDVVGADVMAWLASVLGAFRGKEVEVYVSRSVARWCGGARCLSDVLEAGSVGVRALFVTEAGRIVGSGEDDVESDLPDLRDLSDVPGVCVKDDDVGGGGSFREWWRSDLDVLRREDGRLRGGCRLFVADGDILLSGVGSPGSEIVAGGSVAIEGRASGAIVAGYQRSESECASVVVFFESLSAYESLTIGGFQVIGDDVPKALLGKKVKVFLKDGKICFEELI